MTVTYWREHSNPELSSESALATFNPIIKLAPPSPGSFRRKIDGESDCLRMDERERECVCARGREISLRPWLPTITRTVPTPNRFDEGNRAVRNLHSQISFSSASGRVRASNPDYFYGTHFASLVIHYSGRPTGDDTPVSIIL